jgi:hypothetical protein
MCVICIAQDERMTKDHVEKMWSHNKDGGGIAWREKGKVHWRKGLSEEEMLDFVLTLPLPYVAHFRIASCGGVLPELTHPFPIQKTVPLDLKGSSTSPVLFHNGHLGRWKEILMNLCINNKLELPDGAWSDTRLMAWVAAHCTTNILPHFDERLVNFGVNDMDVWGTGWTKVEGLYVSNQTWKNSYNSTNFNRGMICLYRQCKENRMGSTSYCADHQGGVERVVFPRDKKTAGGASSPTTFRGSNDHEESGETEQKTVEEVAQSLRSAREERESFFPTDAALAAGEEAINFVRRLNPKVYRTATQLRHVEPPSTIDEVCI